MQKSIKKVIASAVAALMVITAMPFSALAAVGDYTPDVQVQFTPVFDNEAGYFGDPTMAKASYDSWANTGLNCAPLVYDATAGTLTAEAADITGYSDYNDLGYEDVEDVVFEEGAVFAVTVRMDNITEAWSAAADIKFSDNVAPVGIYRTGKKSANYAYQFATGTPTGDNPYTVVAPGAVIDDWSASNLYDGMNDTALGDLSGIVDAPADLGEGWSDQIIHAQYLSQGESVDLSAIGENYFYNLATGEFSDNGYDYAGKAIISTFLFQVTGEGAIKFELADPASEYSDTFDGAYLVAKKSDGTTAADKTTYAVNKYNLATQKNDGETEWPGSTKMTFMGKNEFAGEVTPAHVHNYTSVVTDPTCTEQGYTTYTCQNEGCDNPTYVADYTDALGHDLGDWTVTTPAVAATCTTDGTTAIETRSCKREGCTYSETRGGTKVDATGHDLGNWTVTTPAVAATCTTDGTTAIETRTCKNAGCTYSETRGGTKVDALGHDLGDWAVTTPAVAATCTTDGATAIETRSCKREGCTYSETRGGTKIDALGHDLGEWTVTTPAVAPTKDKAGATAIETRTCKREGCTYSETRGGEVIDALGVIITLNTSDIGLVEGLDAGANKVAYGTEITLTATPVEGAKFVGWELNGNIVSKEETFTTKAVSNITITPVFEDMTSNLITVTFYDKYGNTVKQYKDMTAADYQAAIAADYDTIVAPAYPSYTFKAWDKDKDAILALEASATIWAIYEKIPEEEIAKYTVTTNADLALPAGIVNGQIPYDTQVTVSDAAATAWKIGDAIVAYGTSYTFYVGSDVTITPVYAEVEEAASVTIIGANRLAAPADHKYNIVATRNVPDGFTLVDYGFVYGKELADADLDVDNEGKNGSNPTSGLVKVVHAGTRNTESKEFALNYGITAKNANVTAKAFIIVTDKDGETKIVYSDMFSRGY